MAWWIDLLLWSLVSGLLALVYIALARKYDIVDVPNHRSSHQKTTIRGGGIILWIAAVAGLILSQEPNTLIIAGLLTIGILSFLDDLKTLSPSVRLIFQLICVFLLAYSLFPYPALFVFWFAIIIVLANINCYNFMDGINGLSGLYTLLALVSIWLISENYTFYWQPITAALLVFIYFNARPKGQATWFGGDIGSIVSGYFIMYLVFQQIFESGHISFILIIGVYGIDGGWTLLHRLFRRENIFTAHRLHLYQYLANEKKMNHLSVVGYYLSVQVLVNISLYFQEKYHYFNDIFYFSLIIILLSIIYHYFAIPILRRNSAS